MTPVVLGTDSRPAEAAAAVPPKIAVKLTDEQRIKDARLKLSRKAAAARRYRRTIAYYESHRSLLQSGDHAAAARATLRRVRRNLVRTTKEIAYYRRLVRVSTTRQRARRLRAAPPRTAICGVFGRYCDQAVAVAWCESRLSADARNGQYLGLFQMGSRERELFGHGPTAYEQTDAAHRYFVASGRDWSPWSCRWAAY